jgi:hypothetical protein
MTQEQLDQMEQLLETYAAACRSFTERWCRLTGKDWHKHYVVPRNPDNGRVTIRFEDRFGYFAQIVFPAEWLLEGSDWETTADWQTIDK